MGNPSFVEDRHAPAVVCISDDAYLGSDDCRVEQDPTGSDQSAVVPVKAGITGDRSVGCLLTSDFARVTGKGDRTRSDAAMASAAPDSNVRPIAARLALPSLAAASNFSLTDDASEYLLLKSRSLRQACRQAGRDRSGRNCPSCELRDPCRAGR